MEGFYIMKKKEQVIMLTSSLFVLTALTLTGVYVKGNNAREQKEDYRLDLSAPDGEQILEEGQDADGLMGLGGNVDDAPNNDLDYEPDLEEAGSVNVENPTLLPEASVGAENAAGVEIAEEGDELAKKDKGEKTEEKDGEEGTDAGQPESGEAESQEPEEAAASTATVEVQELHFTDKNVLTLPIVGNILIGYSMDDPVYHATLEQYRLSPAMVIGATVGADVGAIWDAQITDISYSPQLGNQVTMSLGDGYECIYAQLEDIQVEAGSYVSKGDIIGKIADPTPYYSVEGPNLYLEILKDDTPVDPMTFMGE